MPVGRATRNLHHALQEARQAVDEEYTRKIREYTTETFFLSPLVDYLPASRTVPTPKAVLGDIAGAPNKLPYSKEVYQYMRMLDDASPRVKVFSIGTTEEGREMIAVAVAHVTQCPYCIRGHTRQALQHGATPEELMEAIWVAAEMRAGGALAHSNLALQQIAHVEHENRSQP